MFSLSGKTLFFNSETFIDKATAVSWSGPGFIFQLIDIMEKSAINLGFTKNTAKILINETFRGSLNLLNSNNISAEKMVETVATRGGTTEAGIKKMKINKSTNLSLDKFINLALYDKNSGYYMRQSPLSLIHISEPTRLRRISDAVLGV